MLGGGCSGLSYQFKYDPKPGATDNVFTFEDVQRVCRSEEHGVPGWHDTRLEGFADSVGLCLRESAREEELRLRDVIHGMKRGTTLSWRLFAFFELSAEARVEHVRPSEAFLSLSRQFHPDRFARGRPAEQAVCARMHSTPQ